MGSAIGLKHLRIFLILLANIVAGWEVPRSSISRVQPPSCYFGPEHTVKIRAFSRPRPLRRPFHRHKDILICLCEESGIDPIMRPAPLDFDSLHTALRAAGEGTRLRVLA